MKIAFLGDSLTWGGYGGDWVAMVAEKMPQHEIVNSGVGGNTVINLLRRVDDVIELEPDVIFCMVGGNDAISNLYPKTRGYYMKSQNIPDGIVTPDMFRQSYRDLLTEIQLNHIHPLVGLGPTEYSPELVEMKHQYNDIAREVANSFNIPVLDLASHFNPPIVPEREPIDHRFIMTIGERSNSGWDDYETERLDKGFTYTFDGMHITPETAEKLSDVVVEFLRQHI